MVTASRDDTASQAPRAPNNYPGPAKPYAREDYDHLWRVKGAAAAAVAFPEERDRQVAADAEGLGNLLQRSQSLVKSWARTDPANSYMAALVKGPEVEPEEPTVYGLHLRSKEIKRVDEYKLQAKADKEEMDAEVAERIKELDARSDKCKMKEFQDSDAENMSVTSGSTQQSGTSSAQAKKGGEKGGV